MSVGNVGRRPLAGMVDRRPNETTNKRIEANRVKCGITSGSILEAEFRDSSVFQKVFHEHSIHMGPARAGPVIQVSYAQPAGATATPSGRRGQQVLAELVSPPMEYIIQITLAT